jgi:uncharacterized protein YdhG (YjbR/CyaY superfamily)
MKSKFIEFARLPEIVFEVAVEQFDDADERDIFLKIVAASKMGYILDSTQDISTQEAKKIVHLVYNLDDCLTKFDINTFINYEFLKKMVEEYKNDSGKTQ